MDEGLNGFVKNVFLTIMGVVVAFILYYIAFGATDWRGGSITGNGATVDTDGQWMGLLYFMSASVEVNMSRYYYEYCYIPAIHKNDSIDIDLVRGDSSGFGVSGTKSVDRVNNIATELYGFSGTANSQLAPMKLSNSALEQTPADSPVDIQVPTTIDYYTTGWY